MSLITPILQKHGAFDATQITHFIVNVGGGGSKLTRIYATFKNNTTGATVYTAQWDNPTLNDDNVYSLQLASNVLTNNIYYSMYIQTWNAIDGYSNKSNEIQFKCFTTPTLNRSNYVQNDTIISPSKEFITIYNQVNGESLNTINNKLINTTTNSVIDEEIQYASTTTIPYYISYQVNGLIADNSYRYIINIETTNGMTLTFATDFDVSYVYPEIEGSIELQNMCDYGLIKIKNGLRKIVGVGHNHSFSSFGGEIYCDLPYVTNPKSNTIDRPYVLWDATALSGTHMNLNSFTLLCWCRPDVILHDERLNSNPKNINISTSDGDIKLEFRRGLKPSTQTYSGWVEYTTTYNNTIVRSNYIDDIGTTDDVYLIYLTKQNDSITLKLTKLINNGDSIIYQTTSGTSNSTVHSYYNKVGNIFMTTDSTQRSGASYTERIDVESDSDFSNIQLYNGSYNHLTIHDGYIEEYTTPKVDWDNTMKFNCDFNNNLNGGIIGSGSNVTDIIVKKRKKEVDNWLNIYEKHISSPSDFEIEIYDPYCINNEEYIYAIVPVNNGIEGEYYQDSIYSKFDGFYIADKNNIFKVMVNVNYEASDTTEYGLLQPLNKKYPIIIHNGITRYNKGTMNCAIMGYKYMKTRKFNTKDIYNMRNDIVDFLNDGESKIIKDWTGNVAIIEKLGDITRGLNAQTGYSTVGFTWVEQGSVDDKNSYGKDKLLAIDHLPDFIIKSESVVS